MTEPADTNIGGSLQPDQREVQVQARVLGQYIKDLSFESPNINKMMTGPIENPHLDLELNVHPERLGPETFETILSFKAKAHNDKIGVVFEIELDYAGLFRVENAPPEALDAMLNVHFPTLLFPFVRRIVADMTRDGGIMPPLMLDPVDFGALYMRKQAAMTRGTA